MPPFEHAVSTAKRQSLKLARARKEFDVLVGWDSVAQECVTWEAGEAIPADTTPFARVTPGAVFPIGPKL